MHIDPNSIPEAYRNPDLLTCYSHHYTDKLKEWKAIEIAIGDGIEWVEKALKKYECETAGSFTFREDSAYNRLTIDSAIEALKNTARSSSDQARVVGASDRIQEVLNQDFDNNGNSWFSWVVDQALYNTAAYGQYFIFASTPAATSEITIAQEKDFNPFCFGRKPLQVLNYTFENGDTRTQGQFSDVTFITSEMVLNTKTMYEQHIGIVVRMTREFIIFFASDEKCSAYDGAGVYKDFSKGDVIRVLPNELGKVPCRMIDIEKSLIYPAVNASKQSMNIQSGMFMGTFDSNFSQKWVSGQDAPQDGELDVGDDVVLWFKDPTAKYNVTPNPPNQIDNAIKLIENNQDFYDNLMQQEYNNLAKRGTQVPSGEALKEINAPQEQATKYLIDQAGDALSDIVAWMHELAGEAIPDDLQVIMPKSYEASDESQSIDNAADLDAIEANTAEGIEILQRQKWEQFTDGEELEKVVAAETAAILGRTQLLNDMDAAGAESTFNNGESEEEPGREPVNQPEGEGVENDSTS